MLYTYLLYEIQNSEINRIQNNLKKYLAWILFVWCVFYMRDMFWFKKSLTGICKIKSKTHTKYRNIINECISILVEVPTFFNFYIKSNVQ